MSAERTSLVSPAPNELKFVVPQTITPRQKDVFELTALGLTAEEVGKKLYLSPATVQTYIRDGRKRLQASTQTEAVLRAERYGLIEVPALTVEDERKIANLMPHQLRVARGLAEYDGMFSADQIAQRLKLRTITVQDYSKSILSNLEVHTRTRAAVMITLFDRQSQRSY